jgi:hypothetical protein
MLLEGAPLTPPDAVEYIGSRGLSSITSSNSQHGEDGSSPIICHDAGLLKRFRMAERGGEAAAT